MSTPDTIEIGTIVEASPCEGEVIIGMVTSTSTITPDMVGVTWISNRRGVFTCWEARGDLVVSDLTERDQSAWLTGDGGDPLLDHVSVARHLRSAQMVVRDLDTDNETM